MSQRRRVAADAFAGFLALNAAACAGAALLSHAGRFSDRYDVLSHFAELYLAAAVVQATAAAFLRNWGRPVVWGLAMVTVTASLALMIPAYVADPGPQAPPTALGQIKVIQ